jgi:hypothetical protein
MDLSGFYANSNINKRILPGAGSVIINDRIFIFDLKQLLIHLIDQLSKTIAIFEWEGMAPAIDSDYI